MQVTVRQMGRGIESFMNPVPFETRVTGLQVNTKTALGWISWNPEGLDIAIYSWGYIKECNRSLSVEGEFPHAST